MKILAVSDMHGDLSPVRRLLESVSADVLLCCGDWGDPGQLTREDYQGLLDLVPVYTVYGNHDDVDLLADLRNRDGSRILLENGLPVKFRDVTLMGISGIWAKSHAKPWYVTDEEVLDYASSASVGVDILMTHGCAIGLNDLTPSNTHGGQRCFSEAHRIVLPHVYICGHLHRADVRQLKSGAWVANVGQTTKGDYIAISTPPEEWRVEQGRI
jgi:uncharacterized protein